MSQAGIKELISRLGTDEMFREQFMQNPKVVIAAHNLDITPEEAEEIISKMGTTGDVRLEERKNPFWWLGWFS